MKYAIRIFVFAVLAAVALTARAQEAVTITGYQSGEFAVKNGIERQLDANVVKPIGLVMAHAADGDLRIFVTGYADKTGSGAENDRIALDRAEQVKDFLSEQFPKATITALTKGYNDKTNARMVKIFWKITTAAPTTIPPKNDSVKIWLIAIIGIVVVIIIAATARPKATAPVQLVPLPQVTGVIPATAKPITIEMVSIEKDGNVYDVPIELKDGMWHTPFPTQADATKIVFRKDRRDAMKAVKACMSNPFYQSAIEQLVANGRITMRQ